MPLYEPFKDRKKIRKPWKRSVYFYITLLLLSLISFFIIWKTTNYIKTSGKIMVGVNEEDLPEYGPFPDKGDIEDTYEEGYKEKTKTVEGRIKLGDTLYDSLRKRGITDLLLIKLESSLNGIFNFSNCRPGDKYTIQIDNKGRLIRFEYRTSPLDVYVVEKEDGEYKACKEDIKLQKEIDIIKGAVSSSLYESFLAAGSSPQLVMNFAQIFAWDFDFSTYTQRGDEFSMIFEKLFVDGEFYNYGKILIARYENRGKNYNAVYFEDPAGNEGYYDFNGRSLKKSFLRSPLRYSHISSGYTNARFHPIHERFLSHRAIDYAAPVGTPVWAVANGKITYARRKGSAGIAVEIRHPNGYLTKYYHLSRIARGIRRGVYVKQKRVVGYVGATGNATGPHLHYALHRYGRPLNPLRVKFPPGRPVPAKFRVEFNEKRDLLANMMERWEDYERFKGFTDVGTLGFELSEQVLISR